MTLRQRLLSKIRVEGECWIFTGSISPNGYGSIRARDASGRACTRSAHRVSYELHVGQVPDGLELDHLCRRRSCCNPAHLEPVTRRENTIRGDAPNVVRAVNGSKSHCKQGHPFTGENLILRKGGGRKCRECARLEKKKRRNPAAFVEGRLGDQRRGPDYSGVNGVGWFKPINKWQAYIDRDGRRKHLGYFATKDEAVAARLAAESNLHGEFRRT